MEFWKYENILYESILNSTCAVYTYDNDKLIGLVSDLSDKCINLYKNYLLVHPSYQNKGVGTTLLNKNIKSVNFNRIELITDKNNIEFYKKNGFIEDRVGCFIINWPCNN